MGFSDSQYTKITESWIDFHRLILALIKVSTFDLNSQVGILITSVAVDLPQYSSYEMLRQQLLLAINEGGEGFGFA